MRAEIIIFVLSVCLAAAAVSRRPPTTIDNLQNIDDYLLYYIYLPSFKDSDGDGVGDFRGLSSKLQHLIDSNVDAYRLAPFYPNDMDDYGYNIWNYTDINPIYGNFDDFDYLIKESKAKNLKVYIDLVPNHMSTKSEYFKKSLLGVKPFKDYFVWNKGIVLDDGSVAPPNNWVSVHGGSAWTYREERKAFYLHQYGPEQPDLNYYHTDVVEEMHRVMNFWANRGVDGFTMGSASYLAEHREFPDEPLSGITEDPEDYGYTTKTYTRNQDRSYEIVQGWKRVLDKLQPARPLIIDTHTNVSMAMKYYDYGARYPLNYGLITDVENNWSVSNYKEIIDNWWTRRPQGTTPNWVSGYPGKPRLVTTCGDKRARAISALFTLLPGVGMVYAGDEMGQRDYDTLDPQADAPASHGRQSHPRHHSSKSRGRHSSHEKDNDEDKSGSDEIDVETADPKRGNQNNKSRGRNGNKKSGNIWKVNPIGRRPYLWDDGISAGFSDSDPWSPIDDNYKELNLKVQKQRNDTFYSYYQAISTLKKSPHFKQSTLVTKELSENVLAFSRESTTYGKAYVLINFSKEEQTVDLSPFSDIPSPLSVYYSNHDSPLIRGSLVSNYKNIRMAETGTIILLSKNHRFL